MRDVAECCAEKAFVASSSGEIYRGYATSDLPRKPEEIFCRVVLSETSLTTRILACRALLNAQLCMSRTICIRYPVPISLRQVPVQASCILLMAPGTDIQYPHSRSDVIRRKCRLVRHVACIRQQGIAHQNFRVLISLPCLCRQLVRNSSPTAVDLLDSSQRMEIPQVAAFWPRILK